MNKFFNFLMAASVIASLSTLTACKRNFDNPPEYIEPNITANTSIADLKALYNGTGFYTINNDIIVAGVVSGDDKSGNFYKSITVQDTTGGITLNLDGTNLYNEFPVGRKLFIKCKGLIISNYARLIQLGGYIDNSNPASPSLGGIPVNLFNKYLVKGSLNNPVYPRNVTIGQLNDSYQSMLIQLDLMSFASADVNKPYADGVNKVSLNRTINDIAGGGIIIRSSGYSNFANELTPPGFGSAKAIYTVFNSTKQLVIRDTTDIKFRGGAPNAYFSEDFETATVGGTLAVAGWGNYSETGTLKFRAATFSGSKYAEISAFNSGISAVKSWLVSPAIDVNVISQANKALLFKTKDAFNNGATLKAYISTNYNGSATPWTSTWTLLPATIASGQAVGFAPSYTGSGLVSLNGYTGNVYIALVYEGADPSGTTSDKTTTYQIDDIKTIGY